MTQTMLRRALAVAAVLVCLTAHAATASSPLASRMSALESELSSPLSLVELSQSSLTSMDARAVISEHVQADHADEALAALDTNVFEGLTEAEQREIVDASLAEVEAAEREGRPVVGSSLLEAGSTHGSSRSYWDNAFNRRSWCNNVRWGYWWIEKNPHWQAVCKPIEKFRPWGWWSHFCHNIHSGSWGKWYRHNFWWKNHCNAIRNPGYSGKGKRSWRWHPAHKRHEHSGWCEKHGHQFRDLNNAHYNHWCYGREAPKKYQRGLWDVDPKATKAEQANYWFCRAYRSYDAGWKRNGKFAQYQAQCVKGEGARGAKHPGYDPAMTDEQVAAVKAHAEKSAAKAKAKASAPQWVWSKAVPRTADSEWCEKNGLTHASSVRFAKGCEGNRETDEARAKRIVRAEKRARARVLRRIPKKRAAGKKPKRKIKQVKPTPFTKNPLVLKARQQATIDRLRAALTPARKEKIKAKLAKSRAAMTKNLPAGVKTEHQETMMKALKLAALAPVRKHKKKKNAKKGKDVPPPTLPPKPKSAPTLSALKTIAKKMRDAATAPKGSKSTKHKKKFGKAPTAPKGKKSRKASKATKKAAAEDKDGPMPEGPIGDAPAEKRDALTLARAGSSLPHVGANSFGKHLGKGQKASRELTIQQQWAKEDKIRHARRRARLAREDKEDAAEERHFRRAARLAKLQALAKRKEEERRGGPGENIDWNAKIPNPGPYVPKRSRRPSRYAKLGDAGCPGCKNRHLRKKWRIVLDPKSVSEIDRPLLEELHRRVDYLIEPVAKKLNLKEARLQSARKQVIDATEHHIRVYDFGLKHKDQLLVPQYIQDEQKIVQLE